MLAATKVRAKNFSSLKSVFIYFNNGELRLNKPQINVDCNLGTEPLAVAAKKRARIMLQFIPSRKGEKQSDWKKVLWRDVLEFIGN